MTKKKINVEEFNPSIETVELKNAGNTGPREDTVKFMNKCVEIYKGLSIGQSFVVDRKYMSPITLKKGLRELIQDTETYFLKFISIKDDQGKTTAVRVGKRAVKKESAGETESAKA
jgi:hypothetical protein